MSFRLPNFNSLVKGWRHGNPTTNPADWTAYGNFNIGRRISGGDYWTDPIPKDWYPTCWLLLPYGTPIYGDAEYMDQGDTVEVPAGTGIFYTVYSAERSALGFPNEHVAAMVRRIPIAPPGPAHLLLEDTTDLLLEDSTLILME